METQTLRTAYRQATACFVDTVGRVAPAQWGQPALGEWSVRDLVGHASRALATVEAYLERGAAEVEVASTAEYFLRARATLADPAAVAARGREAGQALGAAPAAAVQALAERVLARLDATADTALVGTPVGGMRLLDYLPTRVLELTVHTLDLAAALGLELALPPAAVAVTGAVLVELAQRSGQAPLLLQALTGRRPLPPGFSLLGM
ncbi:MAG: hypothetical protein KatS3mg131_3926 [Candidatus Tectimicrobiota bacterium]|nr:MAG: hypothetical protein KatS3mg131_3926 [Candidatus Tectomicrobia bacterium]